VYYQQSKVLPLVMKQYSKRSSIGLNCVQMMW